LNNQSRENLVNDIENRLNDFFSEDQAEPSPVPARESIEKLKSVVLSIDWEIDETCLNDLVVEADALMPQFENDRLAHTLLRMLKAVGGYMHKRQARSHPDAIKRIMSVFASLEKLATDDQMEEALRKKLVAKEIAAFKKLKEQIELQRTPPVTPQAESIDEAVGRDAYVERSKFEQAMSAVEERLNSQVTELKAQLEALQNELDGLRSR